MVLRGDAEPHDNDDSTDEDDDSFASEAEVQAMVDFITEATRCSRGIALLALDIHEDNVEDAINSILGGPH